MKPSPKSTTRQAKPNRPPPPESKSAPSISSLNSSYCLVRVKRSQGHSSAFPRNAELCPWLRFTTLPLFFLHRISERPQIIHTLLDMVIKQITIKRAGVMYQHIAQIRQNL